VFLHELIDLGVDGLIHRRSQDLNSHAVLARGESRPSREVKAHQHQATDARQRTPITETSEDTGRPSK
jgi:hypothetical protein